MKKKKSYRMVILLLLAAAAVVLILVSVFLLKQQKEAEESSTETSAAEGGGERLLSLTGDITEISYSWKGEEIDLVLDNGEWKLKNDADFPVNGEFVGEMASAAKSASLIRVIDDPGSLADYGLTETALIVMLTDDTGETETLTLGDVNNTVQACYCLTDKREGVCLSDSALPSTFRQTKQLLFEESLPPSIQTIQLQEITLSSADGVRTLVYLRDGNPASDYKESANLFFVREDGSLMPVGTEQAQQLGAAVSSLNYGIMYAWQPTAEEEAAAGLTEPACVLTIRYEDDSAADASASAETGDGDADPSGASAEIREYVLEIGNFDEENQSWYVREKGDKVIYKMNNALVSEFLSLNERSLADLAPNDIPDEAIESITVQSGEKEMTVAITRTEAAETETVTGEAGAEETAAAGNVSYSCSGKEMTLAEFEEVRNALNIRGERVLDGDETAVDISIADLTVTYRLKDRAVSEVTISYMPYNDQYHQLAVDGREAAIAVNNRDVKALSQVLDAYASSN